MATKNMKNLLLFVAILLTSASRNAVAKVSQECLQETQSLESNQTLSSFLSGILNQDKQEFNNTCNTNSLDIGCHLVFVSNNTQYRDLCQQTGGKVYKRRVAFDCNNRAGFMRTTWNLGQVPLCVGQTCNLTNIENPELDSSQITSFLHDLTDQACQAQVKSKAPINSVSWTCGIIGGVAIFLGNLFG